MRAQPNNGRPVVTQQMQAQQWHRRATRLLDCMSRNAITLADHAYAWLLQLTWEMRESTVAHTASNALKIWDQSRLNVVGWQLNINSQVCCQHCAYKGPHVYLRSTA